MNTTIPAIHAGGLTKKFGDFTAVDGISFDVKHGEIFGFLGPNGSGKTTTIRMMLGLLRPTEGDITVLGFRVDGVTSQLRQRVGYMSQRFSLYNDLTVKQNLQFYGMAYGLSNSELSDRIQYSLQMSGLEGRDDSKTKELSGGWRQRLALSAAIIHQPEILFLDEPTAGVDPLSRRAFWNLLYEQASKGVTVFVTTHYMDEAEHCQKLAFIQRGRITAFGSPEQIKREVMPGRVLEIVAPNTDRTLQVLQDFHQTGRFPIENVEIFGASIHVFAVDLESIKQDIGIELQDAGIQYSDMFIIEPTLEDVFIASMHATKSDVE